jgi:hypothetical protein
MGVILEDLDDHEGYAARRLPDGTLTGTWTAATAAFTAYLAACGCGWRGTRPWPPTEDGEELALREWLGEHGEPLLARQAERRQLELGRVLEWLGTQRDQLKDPAALDRISRAIDRAQGLIADIQRDLQRQAPQREADRER